MADNRYFNPNPNAVSTTTDLTQYFENHWTLLLIGLIIIVLGTRAVTSSKQNPLPTGKDGIQTVPLVPYWLPFLGHIPNMTWDQTGFMQSLKDRFASTGVFAMNLGGQIFNIVWSPAYTTALFNQKPEIADSESIGNRFLNVTFGFPESEWEKWEAARLELWDCYRHLTTEPSLGQLASQTAGRLREHIKDFVSGNESPVDIMPWEKASRATAFTGKNGETVVEAKLLELVRDFVAYTTLPSFLGTDFLANFPTFVDELWTEDNGFLLLATGLPRWIPIPALTRAQIARKKILDMLMTFHENMEKFWNGEDVEAKWQGLNDVGPLVKARMEVYRKYKFTMRARASIEHSLAWASSANSNPMIFWMVARISNDRALLEMIREEIAPYVQAIKPASSLPIAEAPRMETLDVEGLCNNCPLLKSCYVECMRLDATIINVRVLKQDMVSESQFISRSM
jgi:hypothetical protein